MPDGMNAVDACLEYEECFLQWREADGILQRLWHDLRWKQYSVRLFGRSFLQPRLTAWCSDASVVYRYSGLTLGPVPWHPVLWDLKCRLECRLQQRFNSVLANAYRDGNDGMGWHADNEPELGLRPVIASLSLGAARKFLLRHISGEPATQLELAHGSLLVMRNECQSRYRHAVPKTKREISLRINLTFRNIRVGSEEDTVASHSSA